MCGGVVLPPLVERVRLASLWTFAMIPLGIQLFVSLTEVTPLFLGKGEMKGPPEGQHVVCAGLGRLKFWQGAFLRPLSRTVQNRRKIVHGRLPPLYQVRCT